MKVTLDFRSRVEKKAAWGSLARRRGVRGPANQWVRPEFARGSMTEKREPERVQKVVSTPARLQGLVLESSEGLC